MRRLALPFSVLLLLSSFTQAAPLSGTKSIGPTGDYPSITAAIADVKTQTLGGALVLELQSTYLSTFETFPLVFSKLSTIAVNTLTLRPQTGATNLLISSTDTTAATVDLNGAQFLTIDGRPGGVGANAGSGGGNVSQLTIANTSISGVSLRFINEASSNTLRYITLKGVNTSATSGTVIFRTTTGANGNDNNVIDHCDVGDGLSTPANCIYALGFTGTMAKNNSGNTVSNCNIFNFYAATAVDTAGVRLDGGNTDWSIAGNTFYQTASRTNVAANVRPIYINNTSGNNFAVTGNFIGGSMPNAGGLAWMTSGNSAAYFFQGIRLNVGVTTPSSVQGNTIGNIAWTSTSNTKTLPGIWSGIYVQGGTVNVGTMTGNTIGSGTGTGSISVTTSGTGGTSFGITSASSSTVTIANNTIGSITVNSTASTISASLTGIQVTAGANTIINNTVGSAATPSPLTANFNSLNAATSSTSSIGQQVTGILSSSSASASITGNTVANLNNNYVGTAITGQVRGIVTSAGVNTITSNTVRNHITTSQNPDKTSAQSIFGITDTSTTNGQVISQNTVHSLANTSALANVGVTGIYFASPASSSNVIARNFVHSLGIFSSGPESTLNGMQLSAGVFTMQNNMVRVGLDATGASTAETSIVRGIYDNGTDEGRNYYHNSVYVDGTQTSGIGMISFAFLSSGARNARNFQNNIFVNARSNSGAISTHYAIAYLADPSAPASLGNGLTAGGNIFYAPNTSRGGRLSANGGNEGDRVTLAEWQSATGQDFTSAVGDPRFIAPAGSLSL